MSTDAAPSFSMAEARNLVRDLFQPKPWIYWTDFLLSAAIGYSCAFVYLSAPNFSAIQFAAFFISSFAIYRVSLFMHEIVHFRRGEMASFRLWWNILGGIPILMPSFSYESHLSHHNTNHYGTGLDGEYLPLGNGPMRNIGLFLSQVFIQPIVVVLRFAFLTPISFISPRLRKWTLERVSSFVINFQYRRNIPPSAPTGVWAAMDIACSVRAWLLLIGPYFAYKYPQSPLWRTSSLEDLIQIYVLAVFILTYNYIRTLVAHRYRSEGEKMSHLEQLMDSVDISGDPIFTELLFPVGLRFHGLHHLFPSLPYHNLGIAHRRLMKDLPADSPYRQCVYPNMFAAFRELTRGIRAAGQEPEYGATRWYRRRAEQLKTEREETITADDL